MARRVRPLSQRHKETQEKLEKLELRMKIEELRAKVKPKRRR